jgi:hypothetical protein
MTNEVATLDQNSFLSKDNFEHYYRMANMMAKSDMVPKGFKDKPQDVLIAMEMGRALHLSPLSAIQNIAVINGRPSLWGDAVLSVCSGHPDFENIQEEPILDGSGKVTGYTCTVKRRNRSPVSQSFTIQMATEAGLWGKQGPWKAYPARMLQMRARAFALRDSFADALGGVRVIEEVQDYREDPRDITPSNKSKALEGLKQAMENNKGTTPIQKPVEIDPETGEIIPDLT